MSELAPNDTMLLVQLRKGRHFKANPGNAYDLLPIGDEAEVLASVRRLLVAGHVKKVTKTEPGFWLRITDAGMAVADIAIEADRRPSIVERLASVPVGKGLWDVLKIGFGAVLGVLAAKYFG